MAKLYLLLFIACVLSCSVFQNLLVYFAMVQSRKRLSIVGLLIKVTFPLREYSLVLAIVKIASAFWKHFKGATNYCKEVMSTEPSPFEKLPCSKMIMKLTPGRWRTSRCRCRRRSSWRRWRRRPSTASVPPLSRCPPAADVIKLFTAVIYAFS